MPATVAGAMAAAATPARRRLISIHGKTRLREFRLDRGNGFVPICKCGEWNGQDCNYGLKENVVGCDVKSTRIPMQETPALAQI